MGDSDIKTERADQQPSATLAVSEEAYVGDTVAFEGHGLPPETDVDLVWHSWDGSWEIRDGRDVVGPQYQPTTETVATVTTDADGQLDHEWTIPDDYGGDHTVELRIDGETVAEAELTVVPWFELDRTTAEMGSFFELRGYGIGPDDIHNNYQLTWDGTPTGFVTGVQNDGTATARFRAVGPPGEHIVRVYRNMLGVPFLQNNTQSAWGPVAGGRQTKWTVEVTEPDSRPETMWVDDMPAEQPLPAHMLDPDEQTEAELSVTPTSGQPGTEAVIEGRNFPADTAVDLVWYTNEGIPFAGVEVTPAPRPEYLPTVVTDSEGAFEVDITVPTDIGATKPIAAEIDGRLVATTGFVMQPKIESFSPQSGPAGTEIEIDISGWGWTRYESTPYIVYDNRPLGYICANIGTGDDVIERIKATFDAYGEPGLHFVDIYPTFSIEAENPDFGLKPHLSHLDNHPVRPLPALHFTVEITE